MEANTTGVLPAERRRTLLEHAAAEFARAGYEQASLNRVLRAQGMSKSSFYHYFASKEALFNAVITDLGAELAQALDPPAAAAFEAGDFWERIAALAERLTRLAATEPSFALFAKLFYLPDAPAAPAGPLARTRTAVDAWIDAALAAGRRNGAIGEDLPLTLQRRLCKAVVWAMDEWTIEHFETLDPKEIQKLPAAQIEALRRLLGTGSTPIE
jgi:AcrR family transcriptional regulator